jgi:hypothetical protein
MRALSTAWLVLAAILLPACGFADDKAPDYRYRLTVEVETPEGVKTGSSVIAVKQTLGRAGGAPASSQIYTRVRGEAVAVDLPGGQTLFALLRSQSSNDWAAGIVPALAPQMVDPGGAARFDGVLLLEGVAEVPRFFPPTQLLGRRSGYPMLVTFGDVSDPTSVELVDPDDLAASFGEGVKLKRITVELTDDPVTTGIEGRLGWLPDYFDKMLDGRTNNSVHAKKRLANDLSQGDFSRGILP